jgi:3-methyladenine DNA glycosylase AlkD
LQRPDQRVSHQWNATVHTMSRLYEHQTKKTGFRREGSFGTYYFIRQGDVDDTFKIAEMLVDDNQDLINKAVGDGCVKLAKEIAKDY